VRFTVREYCDATGTVITREQATENANRAKEEEAAAAAAATSSTAGDVETPGGPTGTIADTASSPDVAIDIGSGIDRDLHHPPGGAAAAAADVASSPSGGDGLEPLEPLAPLPSLLPVDHQYSDSNAAAVDAHFANNPHLFRSGVQQ
jgi:hypothetical protein